MKLTKKQLKQIINEELGKVLSEADVIQFPGPRAGPAVPRDGGAEVFSLADKRRSSGTGSTSLGGEDPEVVMETFRGILEFEAVSEMFLLLGISDSLPPHQAYSFLEAWVPAVQSAKEKLGAFQQGALYREMARITANVLVQIGETSQEKVDDIFAPRKPAPPVDIAKKSKKIANSFMRLGVFRKAPKDLKQKVVKIYSKKIREYMKGDDDFVDEHGNWILEDAGLLDDLFKFSGIRDREVFEDKIAEAWFNKTQLNQ